MERKLNIALVSTNKDKYSETFIHNHVKHLPANIHFLFDGYLPAKYSTDGGLTEQAFKNYGKDSWYNFRKRESKDEALRLTRTIEVYLAKNNIDLIYCEYGPSGVEMMPLAKRLNIPLLVHFHGYDAHREDILNSYGKSYPQLFSAAASVITVSSHMSTELISLGCDLAKIKLVPYGVDTNLFKPIEGATKEYTFVSCGRFVAKKSPQSSIRAFAKVHAKMHHSKLVMIGDGELLEECKQLAETLSIDMAIDFKGKLNQQQVADLFNKSLVFIQHSVTTHENDSEGAPLVIPESGACGLPAVSTRHAGIPALINDNETGFLVDEHDIDTMAEKMLLLASNPQVALNMGIKARQKAVSEHSLDVSINQLWALIEACVEGRG